MSVGECHPYTICKQKCNNDSVIGKLKPSKCITNLRFTFLLKNFITHPNKFC